MEQNSELEKPALSLKKEDLEEILNQSLQKNSYIKTVHPCGIWANGLNVFFALSSGYAYAILRLFHKLSLPLIKDKKNSHAIPGGIISKLEEGFNNSFSTQENTSLIFKAFQKIKNDFKALLRDIPKNHKSRTLNNIPNPLPRDYKIVPLTQPKSMGGFGNYTLISQGYWTKYGLEISGGVCTVLPENSLSSITSATNRMKV